MSLLYYIIIIFSCPLRQTTLEADLCAGYKYSYWNNMCNLLIKK